MDKLKSLEELRSLKIVLVRKDQITPDEVMACAILRMVGFSGGFQRLAPCELSSQFVGIGVDYGRNGDQFATSRGNRAGVGTTAKVWSFVKEALIGEDKAVAALEFERIMRSTFDRISANSGSYRDEPTPPDCVHMFSWVYILEDGTDASFKRCVEIAAEICAAEWKRAELWATTLAEARSAFKVDGTAPVLLVERIRMKKALHQLGCRSPFFVSKHGEDGWAVLPTCPPGLPYNQFAFAKTLPQTWAGLRDAGLQRETGLVSARYAQHLKGTGVIAAFFGTCQDAVAAAALASK